LVTEMVLVAQRVGAHRRWWAKGIAAADLLGNGPGGGGDEGGCDCDHERGGDVDGRSSPFCCGRRRSSGSDGHRVEVHEPLPRFLISPASHQLLGYPVGLLVVDVFYG
jgi:hypothetical protein